MKEAYRNAVTVYGIRNCDTCRQAVNWLNAKSIEHVFHDLRADGLEPRMLRRWARYVDWQKLLNKRSKTWRGIPPAERENTDHRTALALMARHPTLVKRPVLESGELVLVGFAAEAWAAELAD